MGASQANMQDMKVASQFFQAAIDDCYTARTKMYEALGNVRWDGPAAISYTKAMEEWNKKFNIVVDELKRIRDVLNLNTVHYQTNEDTNNQEASRIGQIIAGVPAP
ncbi:MAG TPA: WXG100 family type VII secretion target [Actinophytocola sp.]|jgi:uncharacterized protein YukE|uniref:WXG100 family type VII secretion target n=1 Tax=Actinophytocola sp. TaxID=1872138 RepID=UPI002DFA0ECE|nr:WXG100 family type VII secretion target [Actinophytocola sp.]